MDTQQTDYPQLFRQMLQRSGEHALRLVQAFDYVLDAETRELALQALTYLLNEPSHWLISQQLLLDLAPKMEQAGFRDEWVPYLERGIQLSRQYNDSHSEAKLRCHLGFLYQARAKYEAASIQYKLSATLFSTNQDAIGQMLAMHRDACVAYLQRQYPEALELVHQARRLRPEDDPHQEYGYFIQGIVATELKDFQLAIQHLQYALTLANQLGDPRLIALRTGNLAYVYEAQRAYTTAIYYYEQAVSLMSEIQDEFRQAAMYMNIGNVYLLSQQPAKAISYYARAEPIFRRTQDEYHLALIDLNRGIALRELEQWQQAEELLCNSILRWQTLQNVYWLVNTMDDLALLYIKQGIPDNAYKILQEAFVLLESIAGQPGYRQLHNSLCEHQVQTNYT